MAKRVPPRKCIEFAWTDNDGCSHTGDMCVGENDVRDLDNLDDLIDHLQYPIENAIDDSVDNIKPSDLDYPDFFDNDDRQEIIDWMKARQYGPFAPGKPPPPGTGMRGSRKRRPRKKKKKSPWSPTPTAPSQPKPVRVKRAPDAQTEYERQKDFFFPKKKKGLSGLMGLSSWRRR